MEMGSVCGGDGRAGRSSPKVSVAVHRHVRVAVVVSGGTAAKRRSGQTEVPT